MGAFDERPPAMSITNLVTGETLSAQFNPEELDEKLEAQYERQKVQGHSHQPLQYSNTTNQTISFTLIFDDIADNREQVAIEEARKFLLSCLYPVLTVESHVQQAPPLLHFFWPGIFSIVAKLTSLDGKHTLFKYNATMRRWEVKITLEEVADAKIYSSRVRTYGTLRTEI